MSVSINQCYEFGQISYSATFVSPDNLFKMTEVEKKNQPCDWL